MPLAPLILRLPAHRLHAIALRVWSLVRRDRLSVLILGTQAAFLCQRLLNGHILRHSGALESETKAAYAVGNVAHFVARIGTAVSEW